MIDLSLVLNEAPNKAPEAPASKTMIKNPEEAKGQKDQGYVYA